MAAGFRAPYMVSSDPGAGFLTYELQDVEKGKFCLVIPKAVEGLYTCEANGKETSFDLRVLTVTGSQNGYLLEGETQELKLNFSNRASIKNIRWYSPRKTQVIGNSRWLLKDNGWSLQIRNLSFQEDNGTWECHIPGLNITYDIKVIGFENTPNAGMRYAAVNSNVNLSYPLNVKLQDLPDIPEVLIRKLTNDNMNNLKMLIPINANSTYPVKEILNVQFEDAGQYQCQLRLSHRTLNKSIHLIVMKVSAQPLQLNSTEANLILCCHISAPRDPIGQLDWVHTNRTTKRYSVQANKFCILTRTAGLWRCSLLVNEDVKIMMDYNVTVAENPDEPNTFPVLKVVVGVVGPLLLLILMVVCVFICKIVARKRQHAKRMVQAKEHLLAKRTCRCRKELTNDYYHA
ncbi:T-cell surface glycoprotein CD4-like [Tiliqua scincoides]|uniref:T-cell surface glycoprotein CD4-like n=1 Tax=Tiliqua scincoides TaxID=71010 RepID=UPI003463205B